MAESHSTSEKPQSELQEPQRQQIEVDESAAATFYANFFQVKGTPEELIVNFGLNPQLFGVPAEPIQVTQRLVTNYYTAKRLVQTLSVAIQRHEQAFGNVEVDIKKRVTGGQSGTS